MKLNYKQMLMLVTISAAAAFAGKYILGVTISTVITATSISYDYYMRWLFNSIIVYTPSLVIFGFVFCRFMKPDVERTPDKVGITSLLAYFLATYSLAILASMINQHIARIFTRLFGTGEIRDV